MTPSLQVSLRDFNDKFKNKACEVIDDVIGLTPFIPFESENGETASVLLENIKSELRRDVYKLLIAGTVNNGKSTLACAIMGPSSDPALVGKYPLPISGKESTPKVTEIVYAEQPFAKIIKAGGEEEEISFEDFIDQKVSQDNEEFKNEIGEIERFRIGYPNELLKSGVTLIDSPGIEASEDRTITALSAAKEADAAIIVFKDSNFPDGGIDYIKKLKENNVTQIFKIINLTKDYSDDQDELFKLLKRVYRALVQDEIPATFNNKEKAIEELNGELIDELCKNEIYWVKAKKALQAKNQHDRNLLERSNLHVLEHNLFRFFVCAGIKEDHFNRFIKQAVNICHLLAETSAKEIAGFQKDISDQQEKIDKLTKERDELLVAQSDSEKIIDTNSSKFKNMAVESFEGLMDEIHSSLKDAIKNKEATYINTLFGSYNRDVKKLTMDFMEEKVDAWAKNNLETILVDARVETLKSLEALPKSPSSFATDMTIGKMNSPLNFGDDIGAWERVFSAAGGFFTGGLISGSFGAMYGVEGAAGTAFGGIVGGGLAALLGLSFPVLIGAAFVGEAVVAIFTVENKKENLQDVALKKLSETLETAKTGGKQSLGEKIEENFSNLKTSASASYQSDIDKKNKAIAAANKGNETFFFGKKELVRQWTVREKLLRDSYSQLNELINADTTTEK